MSCFIKVLSFLIKQMANDELIMYLIRARISQPEARYENGFQSQVQLGHIGHFTVPPFVPVLSPVIAVLLCLKYQENRIGGKPREAEPYFQKGIFFPRLEVRWCFCWLSFLGLLFHSVMDQSGKARIRLHQLGQGKHSLKSQPKIIATEMVEVVIIVTATKSCHYPALFCLPLLLLLLGT